MVNWFRRHLLSAGAIVALPIAAAVMAPPLAAQNQAQPVHHPLAWAYATLDTPAPPAVPSTEDPNEVHHLAGSTQSYTTKQLKDNANVFDWFPNEHPPMPAIVVHRRSPNVNPWIGSCGWCHLPNGKGRPENAGVAGLPEGYILEQIEDFKNGARKSSDPTKRNTGVMSGNAGGITPQEALDAAKYFASLQMDRWIKVVEADMVPKNHNMGGFYFIPDEGTEKVPLGQMILEMPVDPEASEAYRDPHSGWIAYVPVGSIKKGEDLAVRGGNGKTVACAACHGEGLKGNGNFPPLAGRSPSYLARQLYDIQRFNRNGPGTQLMRPVVDKLSEEDIMNLTAYLASLEP